MDIENLKSWASQPDVCRCCLSSSGSWDMLTAYLNEAGQKEVYSEILNSCFGISLSFLTKYDSVRLVCDLCVGRLHEAYTFRKQVMLSEEFFVSYVNSKHVTETETGNEHSDDRFSIQHTRAESGNTDKISEITSNSEINECLYSMNESENLSTSKCHTNQEIIKKNTQIEEDIVTEHNENESFTEDTVDVSSTVAELKPSVKQVSERKRIKLTCEGVFLDTTACPFRHHRSWFQCFFCTQSFMEISSLRLHTIQTHTNLSEEMKKLKRYPRSLQIDITELKCKQCNIKLANIETMQQHLNEAHNRVIYKECIADYKVNLSPYSCHLCGKQFHVFRTLTTHLNEHYANYICAVCGKSFINSKRLKVHNRTHEIGVFPCSQCGKVLKTKTSKANHMETHSKRVIRCQICLKPMKHYNDRIKHMSEEHNITHKFKCHLCSREYNIKHYLATHIRQTHGHKNKKCMDCGMAFITSHSLKKHMQKHSGVKAFTCDVCNKTYARNHSLREHMRVHDR